jgi:hypothetical protein
MFHKLCGGIRLPCSTLVAVNQLILDELKALGDDLRGRIEGLDRRLQALEGTADASASPALQELGSTPFQELGAEQDGHPVEARTVAVTISPLYDVSRVRVVETALAEIDGVESVLLLELHGDAAHLEVKVRGDVALIGGLRKALQVAFDVSQSDASSFTIALAQPRAGREGGVAAQPA